MARASAHPRILVSARRGRLWLVACLALAGLLMLAPSRPAGADDGTVTFFQGGAACPIAHCNPHLDGREGLASKNGAILDIAVSTPPITDTLFTPSPLAAFNNGLGCTVGQDLATNAPDLVECALSGTVGNPDGPFLYNLTAGESGGNATLSEDWASAPYSATQPATCTAGSPWAVDYYTAFGAPLFDDVGLTYVSDDHSMARYTLAGSGGTGTCAWGVQNPAHAAMISWNAITLPPNGGPNGYKGGYYLVGQGTAGPVVLANLLSGAITNTLWLTNTTGYYVTYNTVSAVQTPTGARLYDSTAWCPTDGGCGPYAQAPGRLYAIDITSPTTAGGTPIMSVAWYAALSGPSGASPMVLENPGGACTTPCGNQIYFDGSPCVASCPPSGPQSSGPMLAPTLYGLRDLGGTMTNPITPTPLFAIDLSQYSTKTNNESGYCPVAKPGGGYNYVYRGIQAAPGLEAPEGTNPDYGVWAYVVCGPTLYRFDAQTGALWSGGGVTSIDFNNLSGLNNYIPSSAIMTVVDAHTGHTTMFMGAQQEIPTVDSYVTALDLETGTLFWKVDGPFAKNGYDTPFQGQLPIARTAAGGNILIASTAGVKDGSNILGIPLS